MLISTSGWGIFGRLAETPNVMCSRYFYFMSFAWLEEACFVSQMAGFSFQIPEGSMEFSTFDFFD